MAATHWEARANGALFPAPACGGRGPVSADIKLATCAACVRLWREQNQGRLNLPGMAQQVKPFAARLEIPAQLRSCFPQCDETAHYRCEG